MAVIRTRIEGAAEMDRALRLLPKQIQQKTLVTALRAGARPIRDEVRRQVEGQGLVDSGRLRDGIGVETVKGNPQGAIVRIGPVKKAFYGLFAEFGTITAPARPILRPSFDARAAEAIDRIGKSLGRAIERAAKKLQGPLAKSGLVRRRRRR